MDNKTNINDKFSFYSKNLEGAKVYFEENFEKIEKLFKDKTLNDFIFEPFKDLFHTPLKTFDKDIYFIITQVALINAVLAGLPGKLGVGVFVSMALEGYMAYAIAKHIGIKLDKPSDIFKYFGILATTAGIILYGFKTLLSFGFSMFSIISGINPLIFAELAITNFVGILFWVGFKEAKKDGSFKIPARMLLEISTASKELFSYQFQTLKNVFSIDNIKIVGTRLKQWFTGDFIQDSKSINGEIFATASMAYLIQGSYEKLDGPLGNLFLEAIRLRWSAQLAPDATVEEIAEKFSQYDQEALVGVVNTVKGKMFELMVAQKENTDNDIWEAKLFEDESHPDSDIIFSNPQTGEIIEVSLKATENKSIIEHALEKYPDTIIMTTDEIAKIYGDDSRIIESGIDNESLQNITEENIDKLISSIEPSINANQVVIGGVAVSLIGAIWPFTMAYARKKISYEQYENALKKIAPDIGISLASRLSYLVIFGPIFAWYLLARGVGVLTKSAHMTNNEKLILIQK